MTDEHKYTPNMRVYLLTESLREKLNIPYQTALAMARATITKDQAEQSNILLFKRST